jgi:hypothetical protein
LFERRKFKEFKVFQKNISFNISDLCLNLKKLEKIACIAGRPAYDVNHNKALNIFSYGRWGNKQRDKIDKNKTGCLGVGSPSFIYKIREK